MPSTSPVERIPRPLALRLYLAPVFWMAGCQKLADMPATIEWFGNPDWGLGLLFPELLAWLAALSEAGGAVLLLCGLAVRWISLPLMVTMLVAIFAVHWPTAGRRSPIRPRRSPTPRCWRLARSWREPGKSCANTATTTG